MSSTDISAISTDKVRHACSKAEPPDPSSMRKTTQPVDGTDADGDSSSAVEPTISSRTQSLRKRGVPKFFEHIDEDDRSSTTSPLREDVDTPTTTAKPNYTKSKTHGRTESVDQKAVKALRNDLLDGWKRGMDPKIDYSRKFEFGGSLGVSTMMIGFPALMWYMWIGAIYYDGKFPTRVAGQSWSDFLGHLGHLVYTGAFPTLKAWTMYWTLFTFEGLLYLFAPGVYAYGKPMQHEGGRQLKYYCSAFISLYVTLAVLAILHVTGIYRISSLIDEFGPLLSVSILSGYLVAIIAYFSAIFRGAQHRMSGYPIYDFFMGAELNPRMFGILDFKMFFEVRLPWYILLLLSISTATRQFEQYGYVSGEVMFLVMAHWLYANACAKGEELIVTSWDMHYEKWGFMLIFWNMSGVPLSYCHCTIYLANHAPEEYRLNRVLLVGLYVSYLFVYWVWDSCNGQKNSFRAMERGTFVKRNTFPQVPWQSVKNPRKIPTATGDSILVDGWYGLARKVHYTCDVFFAICWGLVTGFDSPFPWFYPVFFCGMIIHRAARDTKRCREKYGDAWKEYERQVPYLFIPYVF